MRYKVVRQEHLRKRPDWLVRFLLSYRPAMYEVQDTLELARIRLRYIRLKLRHSEMFRTGKISYQVDGDSFVVSTMKGQKCVTFLIRERE